MLPVISIVGRPNVGKSTLFNWLTKSRDALVVDQPGVTRDRQYGYGVIGDRPYLVVDTGGIVEPDDETLQLQTEQQVQYALQESEAIIFMVDAKVGLTPADQAIANRLRNASCPVYIAVNKTDHLEPDVAAADFYSLGFAQVIAISAHRGQRVRELIQTILEPLPTHKPESLEGIKIAVVGRPNVGKSTLINRLLGEERVVVLDLPGTTRDSIYVPFERRGEKYVLIDTAGVRRKSKHAEKVEQLSMIKTIQAMKDAQVVVLVFNAREGLCEQDLRLAGMIVDLGKAMVLAFNQWDGMDEHDKQALKEEIHRRMPFVDFARRYFISALHGSGVGKLYPAINEAYHSASQDLSTGRLTQVLEQAIKDHQPPLVRGRRVKPRFAHLGSHHPMVIVIHGKQMDELPKSYKRYLTGYFRNAFNLTGVPLIIRFKNDYNPYVK